MARTGFFLSGARQARPPEVYESPSRIEQRPEIISEPAPRALSEALGKVDPDLVRTQLAQFAPREATRILAVARVRDEQVFPTPAVLEVRPTLIGYYRLLLGISQKSFYGSGTGFGMFRGMEVRGTITQAQRAALPDYCRAMGAALADLVLQLSPTVTPRDITELPLITLGSQFQGGNNNTIGKQAIRDVYIIITEIVAAFVTDAGEKKLLIENASRRRVEISLAADPDVRVLDQFGESWSKKVAIEIKGGTDRSNAHNRAGEAEKSHQKARVQGYRDFWTVIAMKGINRERLAQESPTTRSWLEITEVLGRQGPDWVRFRSQLSEAVGIPVA